MTEITITINPKLYQRLRRRALQAKTTVPNLVSDLVAATALLLSDPELMTPPAHVIRHIAAGLDDQLTLEEIAERYEYRLETVQAGVIELRRVGALVQTYDDVT